MAPSLVHKWKKQLLEQVAELFVKNEKVEDKRKVELERKQRKLYEKIDQLTVERDFLKKAGANSKTTTTRIN